MPVFMQLERLFEARTLARQLPLPARQQSRLLQHPPHARRTYGRDIFI